MQPSKRPPASLVIAAGIMCKPPRPGITKTRLAALVGAESAARLSAAFLADVATSINAAHADGIQGWGLYTPSDAEAEIRALLPRCFRFAPQHGIDFSCVVHGAMADLIAEHPAGAMLVNSDSPTLPVACISEAAHQLRLSGDRLVIGPARDGGYYLIGLKTAHWPLFEGIAWSTPVVLEQTLARAARIGLPVVQLREWYDVDEAESFGWLLQDLRDTTDRKAEAGAAPTAPQTRAALVQLGLLPAS